MLFQKRFWPGLSAGSITLTFRRWKRPQAVARRRYRTPIGRIEVERVDTVAADSITDAEAQAAGHPSAAALLANLPGSGGDPIYRISFDLVEEPDPRDVLARDADLDDAAVAEIDRRLERLDRASRRGPWTMAVLEVIEARPRERAPNLAAGFGLETAVFKRDVRKLKNLGLTLSFKPGYDLSPRGRAHLARTKRR